MTTARQLRRAPLRVLREHILNGHPVDPRALEGSVYRGTSVGLPDFVARLSWKTFQKTFYREPRSGRLLGWNVRLEQDGIDAPSRPKLRDGRPITEWNYEVLDPAGVPMPRGFDRGLVIDYSRADNPLGPLRFVKDPLVALAPGQSDELLGVSYATFGGVCLETPAYFTLEREGPITFVPYDDPPPRAGLVRLSATERAWAEQLFAAIFATGGALPSFLEIDRAGFWRAFESSAAPLVRAGLRPLLYTLVFSPLVRGFGRPFFRLDAAERERFLQAAERDRSYVVRQAVVTLKTLASFAYFDDARVRQHFEKRP